MTTTKDQSVEPGKDETQLSPVLERPTPSLLARSTYEAYLSIALSAAAAVTSSWALKEVCLTVGFALLADLIWHSHITHYWPKWCKRLFILCFLPLVIYLGWIVYWHQIQLEVVFRRPQVLSWRQEKTVVFKLNEFYQHFQDLGLPVSLEAPSIGFSAERQWVTASSGERSYMGLITIGTKEKEPIFTITGEYSWYVLTQYLYRPTPSHNVAFAAMELAPYYNCSFWGEARRDCQHDGWPKSLWQIRETYGAVFTDAMVTYAVREIHDDTSKRTEIDPESYLYRMIMQGESILDSSPQTAKSVSNIFAQNGISPH